MGQLELENISLDLGGQRILNDLSIDFWGGHVHALVGPNGAGKSTLAQTIMGLPEYRNHHGKIFFDGEPLNDKTVHERAQRGITLAWQEPARFVGIPVQTFLLAAAKDKDESAVDSALDMVGLDPDRYRTRAVDKTLSGGERKRIEVASILVMEPELVLMDEPDSGIDTEAIEYIFEVIHELKRRGVTVLLITHSLKVLEQADHAFLLCHGQLVDKGSVEKMRAYFEGKCIPCTHKNAPFEGELEANQ
ncbi:MAG: ATP-binding cassette domain-containing protein [Spirochaetia bacterium]